MNCEQLLKALNEYVDGEVDPAICEQFADHLAGCNPCQIVVDNIRHTIALFRHGQPYEMPAEFERAMHDMLRRQWERLRLAGEGPAEDGVQA